MRLSIEFHGRAQNCGTLAAETLAILPTGSM